MEGKQNGLGQVAAQKCTAAGHILLDIPSLLSGKTMPTDIPQAQPQTLEP